MHLLASKSQVGLVRVQQCEQGIHGHHDAATASGCELGCSTVANSSGCEEGAGVPVGGGLQEGSALQQCADNPTQLLPYALVS